MDCPEIFLRPEVDSPSAQQLATEAQTDSGSMEPLNGEELAPDTKINSSNGYAFLDDLAQLTTTVSTASTEAPSEPAVCNENGRDGLFEQDMGSYASRSSSQEDIRLDPSTSASDPKEPESAFCSDAPISSTPTSTRRRPAPTSPTTPITQADFQPFGVEVSEEKAQQLRNDVKRLSPVHVSLRERTLGEVSLTSEAPLSELSSVLANGELENTTDDENRCASAAAELDELELQLDEEPAILEDPESGTKRNRELVIRLSRVDGNRNSGANPGTDANVDLEASGASSPKSSEAPSPCPYGVNLVLERCDTAGFLDSEAAAPRNLEPKTIVEKLHIGGEIEFSSPVRASATAVHCRTLSPIFIEETSELETGSESSEVLASIAAAGVEIGAEDGLTQAIINRLEQGRPEPFTEDSAESLALAAGTRDEVRSDGSDSGLGNEMPGEPGAPAPVPEPLPESDSETSFLDRIPDDILSDKDKPDPVDDHLDGFEPESEEPKKSPILPSLRAPAKSSLKRRLTDCLEDGDDPQPDAKRLNVDGVASSSSATAEKKRNIQFDAVTVYYFPRAQGFTCVPSQGGSTLGMGATHAYAERFSLSEHAAEQRRLHRARLAQMRTERAATAIVNSEGGASSSEDPSDDTDEEQSEAEELDIDSYYFLQPVPTWQRRALLRAAGVRRIDTLEKDECRDIRASREHCGCGCKGYCDPESCPCSRANVKCQVDRTGFPCGCSRDGCANSSGRIEFNPVRVRTHFIHTLMRLELEKKPPHHRSDEDNSHHQENQQQHHSQHNHQQQQNRLGLDPSSAGDCGGFTGLHYDSQDGGARADSLDLYTIRDDCYPGDDCLGDGSQSQQQQRKQLHAEFGQSFQHYGSQGSSIGFQQNPYADYQSYQSLPSTSRSPFQTQFQPVATNPGFSHYGSYGQDPASNAAITHQNHSLIQQQPQQQQHSNVMYEASFAQDEATGTQYTNLNSIQPMSSVVQQIGKLEPFSELLSARYSYYGDCLEQQPNNHQQQQQQEQQQQQHHHGAYEANGAKMNMDKDDELVGNEQSDQLAEDDCDENFGEIIKKSMVETVSA